MGRLKSNNKSFDNSIFIDTSGLVAIYDNQDDNHVKALKILKKQSKDSKFFLSNLIIVETYTVLLYNAGYSIAMHFHEDVLNGLWEIEQVDVDRFTQAQKVFVRFNVDKKWSFVDCTSFVILKELEVLKVLAFDGDFEQMGFKALT